MLKKVLITTAIVLQGAAICFAQTSTPPTAPTLNPHKAHDQKARACKKLADDKGLTGEESRASIAQCMKPVSPA
jgi:hypothetical protein